MPIQFSRWEIVSRGTDSRTLTVRDDEGRTLGTFIEQRGRPGSGYRGYRLLSGDGSTVLQDWGHSYRCRATALRLCGLGTEAQPNPETQP